MNDRPLITKALEQMNVFNTEEYNSEDDLSESGSTEYEKYLALETINQTTENKTSEVATKKFSIDMQELELIHNKIDIIELKKRSTKLKIIDIFCSIS